MPGTGTRATPATEHSRKIDAEDLRSPSFTMNTADEHPPQPFESDVVQKHARPLGAVAAPLPEPRIERCHLKLLSLL